MLPELLLGREAGLAREVAEEDQDVEVTLMVGREDERPAAGQVLEPVEAHAEAEQLGERPGARLGEPPGQLPASGHPVQGDRHRRHPDQHAAKEVRGERDAEPARLPRCELCTGRNRIHRLAHGAAHITGMALRARASPR